MMRLNKQLSDCALEIEEHTMKLQLLNKQLKIAKDSLEVAQAKQKELKSKVLRTHTYMCVHIMFILQFMLSGICNVHVWTHLC